MTLKALPNILAVGLACSLNLHPLNARATLEVSASLEIHARTDFEAPLAAEGTWVDARPYGHCWRPARVAIGWRPYCDGEWIWTDCGWFWFSDEPWAWACYHYGRWVYDSDVGWIWVPDIEWAPAWVYWRVGDGYVGWAPCPPPGAAIAPAFFAFVELDHFQRRVRPSTVIVNNTTIINKTRQINGIERDTREIGGAKRRVVINNGPGVDMVHKATGREIRVVPIQDAARRTRLPGSLMHQASPPHSARSPATVPGPSPKPASPAEPAKTPANVLQPPSQPKVNEPIPNHHAHEPKAVPTKRAHPPEHTDRNHDTGETREREKP